MKKIFFLFTTIAFLTACHQSVPDAKPVNALPELIPDYIGITVPPNIAPLGFMLADSISDGIAVFVANNMEITVHARHGQFFLGASDWRKLLQQAKNSSVAVTVYASKNNKEWEKYEPFNIYVAPDSCDSYIAYRLIEPGYEMWHEMGIYERNLENFDEFPVMENRLTDYNCMNCHSFCQRNPELYMFHERAAYGGTYLVNGNHIEKLNTKTDSTMSALVYPSWHPSGKYIAFSVNDTKLAFHINDINRAEVYDEKSDVVVYDVERHEIVTSPLLFGDASFETFPTFSADGQTLFFCSADAVPMPASYDQVKYNLCSIKFDPLTRTFGDKVDTLYNTSVGKRSAKFPRVSPDGRFLVYTLSDYGNFSIWHKDADLFIYDLLTGEDKPLTSLNSNDVESYHSWSSNSRWILFSSRRDDGLYTRPYIGYIDANGNASKPFLVPQKNVKFYDSFTRSFNVPEFIAGKVKDNRRRLARTARNDPGINVTFVP